MSLFYYLDGPQKPEFSFTRMRSPTPDPPLDENGQVPYFFSFLDTKTTYLVLSS